jgi:tetratricopeptide (TPR) repeat protein
VVAASWDQAAAYAVWCHELAFGDDDTSAVAIEQAARETLQARLTANRGPTNAAQLTILAATHVVEAHQRFLLDELTYLDAHIKFTQTLYQTDFTTVPEDLPAPPEPPLRDHHRALDLYRAVIAEHPNAPEAEVALMMVGALLSDPNGPPNQDRTEQAYEAYTSLVDRYPDSPWASDAARLAGEIDAFERNDQRTAIGHFERALASAPDERRVELALYRLAHSHYRYASAERDAHYDKALDHFWRLLALSEQHHRHTGAYLCLHEEAVVYTAMTIADISKNEGVPALDAAQRVLQSRAGLDSAWAIQAELASILIKRARYDEAIELCEWLAASAAEQTIE